MTTAFQEHIDRVVVDFLETALVVDDETGLLGEKTTADASGRAETETTTVASATRLDLELTAPDEDQLRQAAQDHPLVAKALIDAFADVGVVCSVLSPEKGDQIEERFLRAAARADLLVLDWELHKDGGSTARQLIKAVFDQDSNAPRKRLRVIAIYTGQPGLSDIIDEIRTHLGLDEEAVADGGMSLARDNWRITAFAKRLGEELRPELDDRQIAESDLPKRLATEFARLTDGLVPAVTLAALAAIRSDTHRVLQALPADLDIGYLGHRVASPFPEDVQGHLVEMIAAEITSVLGEHDVGKSADVAVIEEWLAVARSDDPPLKCGAALTPKRSFDAGEMTKLLEIGLGLDEELGQHKKEGISVDTLKKKIRPKAAHLFTNDAAEADESADIFALRTAVRTVYSRPRRILRLGTIVLRDDRYLVCLQPRCDSVRLKPGVARGYPFLPLKVVDRDEAAPHEFVVQRPDDHELLRLQLSIKPYTLVTYDFLGGPHRYVEATEAGPNAWELKDASDNPLRWVAELKPEFAQRVAVNLAAEIARVGLAESELVRLSKG